MFTEIAVFGRPAAMMRDGRAWLSVNICGLKLPMPPTTEDTEGASYFGPTRPPTWRATCPTWRGLEPVMHDLYLNHRP